MSEPTISYRFCHFHQLNWRSKIEQMELFATLATIEIAPDVYAVGIAIKSDDDNGSRLTGRTLAQERAALAATERLDGKVPPVEIKKKRPFWHNTPATRGAWTGDEMRIFIKATRKYPEEIFSWIRLAHDGDLRNHFTTCPHEWPLELPVLTTTAEVTDVAPLLA